MSAAFRALAAIALLAAAPGGAEDALARFMAANGYTAIPMTKLRTGHEAVPVTLNGVAGSFIVDSGANATIVDRRALARFGIKPETQLAVGGAMGAGGVVRTESYSIRTLRVGGQDVPSTTIQAIDLTGFAMMFKLSSSAEVDGIIGQDVLTRYGGVIDVANNRLYLKVPA